ncbi:hypothetical protein CIHG_08295 [Coccidioides immitis H538.4]|uniref:Uncharacterized protein n=2 Tax=Coccidioides immitis TaxID=5501 RepID=A0A0J8S2K2_COCIT|nr:hypothetical protein CIRG_02290 [Coccidioides immitis RMSCC 2394]KMU90579.1 hypothetical protein CIHG_08295 [Coccidioides immitis H538.4]
MSVTIPLSSKPNRELGCALATATSAAKGSNIKYGRERDRGKAALDYLSAIAVIYLGTCCRSEHPTFASSGPPLTLWDYGLPTEVQGCLTRQHTQNRDIAPRIKGKIFEQIIEQNGSAKTVTSQVGNAINGDKKKMGSLVANRLSHDNRILFSGVLVYV